MRLLLSLFNIALDILFPQVCVGCKKNGTPLCEKCLDAIPVARAPEYAFISSILDYRSPAIRKLIWQFKYKNARRVAKCFGEKLYEDIIAGLGEDLFISKKETFLLVPIPLHKKRLRERGYNQSELLAREIQKYDTEEILELSPKALVRTRATNAQAKKEKRLARFENLRGAFAADPKLVHRRNIILIDDVTTTGATLAEARKVLLKAGARSVKAWTVAH